MKKLLLITAALMFSTALAFAEPCGDHRGDAGVGINIGGAHIGVGVGGRHEDRGERRDGRDERRGEHRDENRGEHHFHRGFHGGHDRDLYRGDPCWNWLPVAGWVYICD